MARCSVMGRASAIPTAARGPSVYATGAVRPRIREVGVFNTTTTACSVAIQKATTAGTQGAALTELCEDDDSHVVIATGFNTHTADATIAGGGRRASLGAAIGSGVIFTFGENGMVIDNLTTIGCVITSPEGNGQIIDFYFVWDE